ncbi:F-box/FBD/LRR-repeat protein At1g13570-like [Ipomoea triloba]|uniref:F-box/FBD/LRR-repeat protein At1g13570-like n=1 Tax=Ipomoea triloba TaxID=35885 RepID=UPI00125D1CC5|nr:F-box/FBD/LRR-repeat protein At1g13570-like [Ipomoea triloba]
MARQLKIVVDASRDLISELPVEIKERILECLPTRDAARTAMLSRHWNDVWLQHERLTFDSEFVQSFQQSQYDDDRTPVNIINNILFSRAGPIKKFTLQRDGEIDPLPLPQQYDIDRWCIFLSRNGVEELNLCLYSDIGPDYQLQFCLLSCRTIKKLIVDGVFINLPVNACGIFFNVTSLAFFNVTFKRSVNGIVSSISIPKLEKLVLEDCEGINKFEISPPKLEILSVIHSIDDYVDSRWLAPHLKTIKTLWLCGYSLSFRRKDDQENASRLLEDGNGCLFIQELHMLNSIKIEAFNHQSALEMLFMKTLLSKSPALERVVIVKSWHRNAFEMRKIQGEFERFPRASPNAQIVCIGNDSAHMSEDGMRYPWC